MKKGMSSEQRKSWMDKSKRLNENITLARGMKVIDVDGHRGVVVNIEIPEEVTVENHGSVAVWQSERFEYGSDNCEHYCYINWKEWLRVEEN